VAAPLAVASSADYSTVNEMSSGRAPSSLGSTIWDLQHARCRPIPFTLELPIHDWAACSFQLS
jgi:hypothetical protein